MKLFRFFIAVQLLTIIGFFTLNISAQPVYTGNLGYGISPKGHPYDYSEFGGFLQEVANTCKGGVVFANYNWRDGLEKSGIIPETQKTICLLQPSSFNYVDMINFGWASYPELYLDSPSDTTNNWSNASAKSMFLQMLIHAADSLQPTFFFIGNEVSMYWDQDSSDYMNWAAFYHSAYDSIKAHSPASLVGTTFNYEHLSGQGQYVGWDTAFWNALDVFDTSRMDMLGLTVYPFFGHHNASDIPSTYLDPIFSRMGNKTIVITETGWPADSLIWVPWKCSPSEQVDYVNKLFTVIDGHKVADINWLYLNYLMDTTSDAVPLLFKSISLRDSLGNDRPALPLWLSHCGGVNIENHSKMNQEISLFPNPANNRVTIDISDGSLKAETELFDISGNFISRQIFDRQDKSFDISYLAKGVYFLKIKTAHTVSYKNFVKF